MTQNVHMGETESDRARRLRFTKYESLTAMEYEGLIQEQFRMIAADENDQIIESRALSVITDQSHLTPKTGGPGQLPRYEDPEYGPGYQRTFDQLIAYRDQLREERDKDPVYRALIDGGRALYGERYQSDLARDLGVSPRTVGHWVKGRDRVPAARLNQIADLLDVRADACRATAPGIRETAEAVIRGDSVKS